MLMMPGTGILIWSKCSHHDIYSSTEYTVCCNGKDLDSCLKDLLFSNFFYHAPCYTVKFPCSLHFFWKDPYYRTEHGDLILFHMV
jgi:hypothetical protein